MTGRVERLSDPIDAAPEFEGQIREFIRRDISIRKVAARETDRDAALGNLDSLIARVAGVTQDEIDRVIAELHSMRATLHAESERVRREITNFAGLSQTAVASMKVISEGLQQWQPKEPPAEAA
jgi:ABC-type transporter Mla subunit MlaD